VTAPVLAPVTPLCAARQDRFSKTDVFKYVEIAEGRVWMRPGGVACFAGDLSADEQAVVYATHFAPALGLFLQKHDDVAWRSKRERVDRGRRSFAKIGFEFPTPMPDRWLARAKQRW
jgi:hypothetical protein